MNCVLCLEVNENSFDINGREGGKLNAKHILQTHFQFCFESEHQDGIVCRKCWLKVEIFHNFYLQIEFIHRTSIDDQEYENIFVQTLKELPVETSIKFESAEELSTPSALVSSKNEINALADDEEDEDEEEYVPRKIKKIKKEIIKTKAVPKIKALAAISVKSGSSTMNKCETCGERFLTTYKLKNHIKDAHLKLEFKCSTAECNESFVSKQMMVRHIRDKHTTVTCEHCQKEVRKSYLKKHIRSVHSLEDQTMCHLCGKVSNTKEAHNVHYITEHSDQNGVQCDICKTWYKNKLTIRMHFLYRHKQKPVICPICGKLSPNKKALTVHKRIHREDYKERFKCPICGKGFRDRTKLREHSYSHSGISDAYRCNHCEKTFRYGSDLSKHRKKTHPVEENLRKTSNYLGII